MAETDGIPGARLVGLWRGQGREGRIVRARSSDNSRVGCCWMQGRLRDGDLLMYVRQRGDCFYDAIPLERFDNAIRGLPHYRFPVYLLGEDAGVSLSDADRAHLAAGGTVWLDDDGPGRLVRQVASGRRRGHKPID